VEFARIIKELREEKGLTKFALAKELGISHAAVVLWENGTNVPSVYSLIDLSKFFKVSIDYLVGLEK
jgi:transcriptional regulator with XRE-family HTH domain